MIKNSYPYANNFKEYLFYNLCKIIKELSFINYVKFKRKVKVL